MTRACLRLALFLTMAALGACDGAAGDGAEPDAAVSCPMPSIVNDARCPATSYGDCSGIARCSVEGLTCGYPGEGDEGGTGATRGCFGTATLRCGQPPGSDAGAEAVWICTR